MLKTSLHRRLALGLCSVAFIAAIAFVNDVGKPDVATNTPSKSTATVAVSHSVIPTGAVAIDTGTHEAIAAAAHHDATTTSHTGAPNDVAGPAAKNAVAVKINRAHEVVTAHMPGTAMVPS